MVSVISAEITHNGVGYLWMQAWLQCQIVSRRCWQKVDLAQAIFSMGRVVRYTVVRLAHTVNNFVNPTAGKILYLGQTLWHQYLQVISQCRYGSR